MKKNIAIALVLLMNSVVQAHNINGSVVAIENNTKTPLVGAYVIWAGTSHGTVTDSTGSFTISHNATTNKLVASYVGYTPDTIVVTTNHTINFVLKVATMEDVDVIARTPGATLNRKSTLVTTNINSAELCKAACCNLGESFETNASVDVNYTDAATGARTIQLLGLSGRYVQMLTENIPNLRGIAAPFGLSYVPGPWMDGIQVSKGVGTVVNGYEAFTGQINIEYKKPISDEIVAINLFGSSAGRAEANANTAFRVSPKLTTAFIINYANDLMSMDENNDNFRDEPQTKQLNLLNRWNFHTNNYTWQLVIKTLNEERTSGNVDFKGNKPIDNIYGVSINTDRVETWMKNGFIFNDNANLGITTAYIYHNQNSFFGKKEYNGTQHSFNANAIFNYLWNDIGELHAGISSQGDIISESINFDNPEGLQHFSINDISVGGFAQFTLSLQEKLTAIAGIRTDWNNQYNFFVTPRFHVRYQPLEHTIVRLGIGKGYRTAALFAENNYLLANSRQWTFDNAYHQESAWNMGINITQYLHIADKELMLNAEFYHTYFNKQLITDIDVSPRLLIAHLSKEKSFANTLQIEGKYSPCNGLDITMAWRWNEAKQTLNNTLLQRPLVSKYKGLITLSYATPLKKWQFDFNMQINGSGRIPTTIGNPDEYQRQTKFNAYNMFNGQITKYFRTWSIYAGVENMGNFTQKNPIIAGNDPFGDYFDASLIWGPLMSRKYYIGIRWSLEKE